jgi:hypothetical protein
MKRREKTTLDLILEKERQQRKRAPAEEPPGDPEPDTYEDAIIEFPEEQCGDEWQVNQNGQAKKKDGAGADARYRFAPIDSKTFFNANYSLEWLVQRVLVRHQPAVVGGPKKTLKTSTLVDLAVSLATATPFLGRFDVYKRHRIVIISGESGEAVLQECGRRVCAARDVNPEELSIWWDFRLPQIANPIHRASLSAGLKKLEARVVVIDPLYLALLTGANADDVEAGNLYKMGPLLSEMCRTCLDAGATPILSHHSKKGTGKTYEPLDLDDLSFAGIAEFARQWILENRREPFDPNTGSSKLWLSVGGSAGQSGCWAVDVEEGILRDDFTGRKWEVTVHTATDARHFENVAKEQRAEAAKQKRNRDVEAKLLDAIDKFDPDRKGVSFTKVRDAAGLSGTKANRALQHLIMDGILEEIIGFETVVGNGAIRKVQGVRRAGSDAGEGTSGTSGQHPD